MEISMTINTAAHIIYYCIVHRYAAFPFTFSHAYEAFYDSPERKRRFGSTEQLLKNVCATPLHTFLAPAINRFW